MRAFLVRAAALALIIAPLQAATAQSGSNDVSSLLQAITPRALGPTNMGGRISNIAVYEKEPRIFYVATASGGLWKTTSGGIKFSPVFEYERTVALGAVTIDQDNPDIVWLGTGEENSRNSTSWGDGLYKSTDGGKTWAHMGLKGSRHISQIVLHPKDKNTIYVGALGTLWGPNEERGLYKSTDGGKTWTKILHVGNQTGVIDLVVHPDKPDMMLVGMWQRNRLPYRWESGGPESGLHRTTDGGKTWTKVTKGMPAGDIGRIGLSAFRKNPNLVFATFENREGGVFKSTDFGNSWEKMNSLNPRAFYYSTPYVDPNDENLIYLPAVNFHYSTDGGKTFRVMQMDIHVDHHAIWVNPADSNHIIIGNDGGVAQTRDKGATWEHLNNMPIGQFYAIGFDMRKPYWVYGGLQDNGTWGGPTQSHRGQVTFADFNFINGGDGFHAQVDPSDWRIVYAESQGGAINRHNIETGESRSIRPRAPQGETYRFNWSSPIVISPHNPHTIWFAGNKLFKSVDRGDNWQVVSPDLTTAEPDKLRNRGGVTPEDTGAERHCTIVTISESPMRANLVWVGTDDGLVHVTQNGGHTWENVTENIQGVPKNTWVSRVAASRYKLGRAYVAFDGHRNNDYNSYLYVTEDFGKTWKSIGSSFGEDHSVYAFAEGTINEDLLFAGTELGLWVSIDRGESWTRVHKDQGFPTVRVDDLAIHPRDHDLIIGTHGRSIWLMPIGALEQLTAKNRESDVFLCKPNAVYNFGKIYSGWFEGDRFWGSPNTQPGGYIYYYLKSETSEKVEVTVDTPGGANVGRLTGEGKAGLNMVRWRPGGRNAAQLTTGDLIVTLKVGEKEYKTTLSYENLTSGN
ncbi:hypothetical protein QPK87_07290 [Kamptonema cortianum]|nr:hypothetical protein [Kamptonema cortianum]